MPDHKDNNALPRSDPEILWIGWKRLRGRRPPWQTAIQYRVGGQADQQAWIIEDDYDSEFHYAGKPRACVQGLDPHQRTIYIGTFTKSLFPGLRIGYMVLPPQLVAPMTVARTLLDGHSAPIPQLTLARFIEGGHFGAYVRTMRDVYAERRDVLERLVREHLADFVEPRVPAGGMQMPCVCIRDASELETVAAARRAGIDLLGLTALHASSRHKAGFLMGFAAHTPKELAIAVERLADVLRRPRPESQQRSR